MQGGQSQKKPLNFLLLLLLRGCARTFFLSTIGISQSVVYRVRSNVDSFTHFVQPAKKGKHPKRKLSDDMQSKIIEHINSFPRSESNYCRQRSSKTYLEGGLSIAKMHEMYLRSVLKKSVRNFVERRFIIPTSSIRSSTSLSTSLRVIDMISVKFLELSRRRGFQHQKCLMKRGST